MFVNGVSSNSWLADMFVFGAQRVKNISLITIIVQNNIFKLHVRITFDIRFNSN